MGARAAVLSRVLGNRSLRHIGIAFAGFGAAEYGVWTAMLVYAYRQGGATTAGVVAVVQLVPSALIGPPAAAVADARGGLFALELGYVWQASAMAGTAAVLLDGWPGATGLRAGRRGGVGCQRHPAGSGRGAGTARADAGGADGGYRALELDRGNECSHRAGARRRADIGRWPRAGLRRVRRGGRGRGGAGGGC